MIKLQEIVKELCSYSDEQEWFEFKENWFEIQQLGEYISAISNAAAYLGKKNGYFIWGVNDKTHDIVGTEFNYYGNYKNEPMQNFLARNLNPKINFKFAELYIERNRVVVLTIPAAKDIPTSFNEKRYIRIGSSRANLSDYPLKEKELFKILESGPATIENTESQYQDLSFNKLLVYYASKGIELKEKTFKKNLGLLTENGKYNILAQLLSDDSKIPLRVSIFEGENKASKLFSVREFGYNCILYTLDEILRYGDVLNILKADESNRVVERIDVSLFESDVFREAIINSILHNKWVDGNEPMISVFSNRIEILSRGSLAPNQTLEGFYHGESVPVNPKLSEIFLQLHISEKAGRGVPKIIETYGKEAYEFRENSIVVKIPFKWVNEKSNSSKFNLLNDNRKRIIVEIRKKPSITKKELSDILHISPTAIDNNISYLKKNNYIHRIGSNKSGYWEIID